MRNRFFIFIACLCAFSGLVQAGKPVIVVQAGHSDSINGISLRDNGRNVLTRSVDGVFILWDAWTGKEIGKFADPKADYFFLDDGQIHAITSRKVCALDPMDGVVRKSNVFDPPIADEWRAYVSPDRKWLAVTTGRGYRLFDTASFSQAYAVDDKDADWGMIVKFFPDGKRLLLVSGKDVTIRELTTGKVLVSYRDKLTVQNALISGNLAILQDDDGFAFVDAASGLETGKVAIAFPRDMTLSKDGKAFAFIDFAPHKTGSDIVFVDIASRAILRRLDASPQFLERLSYSVDGRTMIIATTGQKLEEIDPVSGRILKRFGQGHGSIRLDALVDSGRRMVGWDGEGIVEWNLLTGRIEHSIPLGEEIWFTKVSPDGQFVAVAAAGVTNGISILDAHTGAFISGLSTKVNFLNYLVFSPDGKRIAYPYSMKKIHIAEVSTGQDITSFEDHTGTVECVAFSHDGSLVFSGGHDLAPRSWDSRTGAPKAVYKPKLYLQNGVVQHIAVAPDDMKVALNILNSDSIALYPVEGGDRLWSAKIGAYVNSVIFSPDGKQVVVGSQDGRITFLSVADGKTVRALKGHTDGIDSLFFLDGMDRLCSCGQDGRTRLWTLADNSYVDLITAATPTGNQWITITDDGYWDGSSGCSDLVAVAEGWEGRYIDQFAPLSDRPDIILQRLGNKDQTLIDHYKSMHSKRLRKLGIDEGKLEGIKPPEVRLKKAERTSSGATIQFSASAGSAKLASYRIYIDGCPANGPAGTPVPSDGNVDMTLPIPARSVLLEVSCMDVNGTESVRAACNLPGNDKAKGTLYCLCFGVSAYKNNAFNLGYAAKDAMDLATTFTKCGSAFQSVQAKVFTNSRCTADAFSAASQFLTKAKPDDTVILFIAGHGMHDTDPDATYYYLTWETELDNLSKTAVNFETIESLLSGCTADRKLFLMDTCESGEAGDEEELIAQAPVKDASSRGFSVRAKKQIQRTVVRPYLYERDRFIYNDLARRSGAVVFSSCKGGELSYEFSELRNGVFTWAILKALAGDADMNGDKSVDGEELRKFVADTVAHRTASPKYPEGLQHPVIDRDNIHARFLFPDIGTGH